MKIQVYLRELERIQADRQTDKHGERHTNRSHKHCLTTLENDKNRNCTTLKS